jgi:hypothetical protein
VIDPLAVPQGADTVAAKNQRLMIGGRDGTCAT